jgi:hypothetical protein
MSWWQLDSVLKEAAAYENYYRSIEPVACPNDGTPLVNGPPQSEAMKYCPNGDFVYPRDYDVNTMAGM